MEVKTLGTYYKLLIQCFCCLFWINANAQDTVVVSKNFLFNDGIYLTLESFQQNQPDLHWDSVKTNIFTNPQTFLTQIEFIKLRNQTENKNLDLENIWGISLAGIPYIRLDKKAVKKDLTVFAGLQLRGKICYFTYEDYVTKKILMPVYNPVTGRPYRVAEIERESLERYKKIMRFDTGEIVDFNPENVRLWTADDQQLIRSMNELSAPALEERLFKILLIYDDRNKVQIISNRKVEN